MRFHDYHLRGYDVTDFGKRLRLNLVFDYPGKVKDESQIEFSNVALYNFVHTCGAIITDIEQATIADVLAEFSASLSAWSKQHGIQGWHGSQGAYQSYLESKAMKAWLIDSAIGFTGFVIARDVTQIGPDKSPERARGG